MALCAEERSDRDVSGRRLDRSRISTIFPIELRHITLDCVMRGLDPRIHPFFVRRWIAGSSPAMTAAKLCKKDVDARDKLWLDGGGEMRLCRLQASRLFSSQS
jgi:hypothetical protein